MKILFSNPPWWTQEEGQIRAGIRAGSRWPFTMRTNSLPDQPANLEYQPYPFFMGYAAAYAQAKIDGAQVIFRDSIARRESYGTWLEYIAELKPDFVVIESATPSWDHDKHCLKLIKDAHAGAYIIVAGTVTVAKWSEIMALGHTSVLGEYEKGVVRVIEGGERGMIAHDFLTSDEMNAQPFPMFDEPYALTYWDACPSGQVTPHLQIWTNRGCYWRCVFCAWPAVMTNNDPDGTGKRNVRFYSADYVEEMIRARLLINPGIQSIYIDDDTFNLGDKHALAISAVMERIGLPWSAMCRADTVKESTWLAMKESGCIGVKLGMESGSQYVVDKIVNKRLDIGDVEQRVLPYLKSIGLNVHTTWTVGLPGETPAQSNETLRMIERLYAAGLHQTHQLSGTALIEGTPLDTLSKQGTLTAYPGASMAGFVVDGDGQHKIEGMQKALPAPKSEPLAIQTSGLIETEQREEQRATD